MQNTELKGGVVCFLKDRQGRVVFIRKTKPQWQAGLLNGVGGKVDPGEEPAQTMIREWEEEMGFHFDGDFEQYAVIRSDSFVLYVYRAECDDLGDYFIPAKNDAGEDVEIHTIHWVVRGYENCVPNLRWLLPLAFWDNVEQQVEAKIGEAA